MIQLPLSLFSQSSEGEERRHDRRNHLQRVKHVACFCLQTKPVETESMLSDGYSDSAAFPVKGSFSNLLSYSEQLAMGKGVGLTFPNYYAVAREDDHIFGLLLTCFTSLSDPQLPLYFSQVFGAMPETKRWKHFNKRYPPNKVFF